MPAREPGRGGAEQVVAGLSPGRQMVFAALLLAVALSGGEGLMRAVVHLRGDLPPTPDESLEYEWKWARDRLEAGSPRRAGPTLLRYDRDLGWRNTPGYDRDGQRINAQGLRARRSFPPQPPPGIRRLALLGDSFSFGDHVRDEETFAHFLESRELPGWQVMNFAVNGYGTDQALLVHELHGRELRADVMVMGFYVGDYERNTQTFKLFAKPRFEPSAEGLRLTGHPVVTPEALYAEYASGRRQVGQVGAPYLWLSVRKALRRLHERWPSESDPQWAVLSALMARFREYARALGAEPVWLVLPYHDVVEEGSPPHDAIEALCAREARAIDLPLLSVAPAFREHAARHPEVRLYRPREIGGHFSAAGHALVAELLADFLRTRGLVGPEGDS